MSESPLTESPRPSVQEMQRRLAKELSVGSRVAFTLLLAAALAVAAAVGSLWATEPALPLRTRVAFGGIVLVALAWAAAFAWTLARRKVLLARHRLVTTRLAVVASTVFTAGALAVAATEPSLRSAAVSAAALGAVMVCVAGVLWRRAAGGYRRLEERVRVLQRGLEAASDAR